MEQVRGLEFGGIGLRPNRYPCVRNGSLAFGAGEGNRTLDIQLGKLSFYH